MRSSFDNPGLSALALAGATALLIGGASLAMGQAENIDTDGDGMVSLEELLVLVPTITEAEFLALDADGDGLLSAEEIAAAQDAGLIPSE